MFIFKFTLWTLTGHYVVGENKRREEAFFISLNTFIKKININKNVCFDDVIHLVVVT